MVKSVKLCEGLEIDQDLLDDLHGTTGMEASYLLFHMLNEEKHPVVANMTFAQFDTLVHDAQYKKEQGAVGSFCSRCGGTDPTCYICGQTPPAYYQHLDRIHHGARIVFWAVAIPVAWLALTVILHVIGVPF